MTNKNDKIRILEVPSELGAGTRGASLGIGAIKVAALNAQNKYFSKYTSTIIPNENELLFEDSPTQYANYIDGIVKVYNYVSHYVSEEVTYNKRFPIVLAGDHSTAGATITGIKKSNPDKRLGVIWIDAHADLHTPYTTPSGNVHGMPLAVCLGIDNIEHQRNDIPKEIAEHWHQLKHMGGVYPKIEANDLVFIALRDTEEEEDFLTERLGIRNFAVKEVREKGTQQTVKEVLAYLNNCDMIYVSFDVDSMDCELVSKGTGTPVPNGLSEEEATDIVCGLVADPKTCCLEVTEVNPTLDNKQNTMAETAFRVLDRATNIVKNR
ncbi:MULTISPECIES: arginase [unclassified Aureispira]|uniref:arginase n=1 Tax=unclassified Aureispira TaxID=2649989 RepID=UPI00069883E2|nr:MULTISPECIES: arginase [unclassified Aureispira]WMX15556.1 arginase [Aureispira sp. CCB-E]